MTQDQLKAAVAAAAVETVLPMLDSDTIIGIGTGSTANLFIDALAAHKFDFAAAVASSEASAERLRSHGIEVVYNHRSSWINQESWRRGALGGSTESG